MHDVIRGVRMQFLPMICIPLPIQCQTRSRFGRTSWGLSISPWISSTLACFATHPGFISFKSVASKIFTWNLKINEHGIFKKWEVVLGNHNRRLLTCLYILFLHVLLFLKTTGKKSIAEDPASVGLSLYFSFRRRHGIYTYIKVLANAPLSNYLHFIANVSVGLSLFLSEWKESSLEGQGVHISRSLQSFNDQTTSDARFWACIVKLGGLV